MTSCGVIRPASISWKVWPIVCSIVGEDQSGNSVSPPSSTSLLPALLDLLPERVARLGGRVGRRRHLLGVDERLARASGR